MILVPVGEQNALDLAFVLFEIRRVGDDEVHAEHAVVGEAHAATISSAYSMTVMFLPISPMPPSGMMRTFSVFFGV